MSRRQRTTIIISARVPLPVNMTQKRALDLLTIALKKGLAEQFAAHEIVVKLEGRETTYLN